MFCWEVKEGSGTESAHARITGHTLEEMDRQFLWLIDRLSDARTGLVEQDKRLREQDKRLREQGTCSLCGEGKAMHAGAFYDGRTEYACCRCFVRAGHPPSDRHPLCMAEYEAMKKEGHT